MPIFNGTFNADDDLVAPWWVPGWTAQNHTSIVANTSSILGPRFPTNLVFVNITGNFFDLNSSGIAGYVTIQMSSGITVTDTINGVANTFRMPQRYIGAMTMAFPFAYNNFGSQNLYLHNGHLNIEVFASDQTTSGSTITTDNGNALFYFVTEHWLGGRTYHIQVPSADAPGPVDINSLIVAGTINPYQYDPVFPLGNMWSPEDDTYNTVGPYTGV